MHNFKQRKYSLFFNNNGGLKSFVKISKFIDSESKLKLVLFSLSQIGFWNALLYGMSNAEWYCFQLILIAAVRIIVNMPS